MLVYSGSHPFFSFNNNTGSIGFHVFCCCFFCLFVVFFYVFLLLFCFYHCCFRALIFVLSLSEHCVRNELYI